MADRDPTTGELAVLLNQILAQLKDVATKEFVETKFGAFNDRVARLERDQQEWTKTSTAAHVELDKDSKARHQETESEIDKLKLELHARIDKVKTEFQTSVQAIVSEQREDQKEIKSVRNGRITSWIGIGIAWIGTVAMWFIQGTRP